MTYLALLRGINVGGNNKVEMGALRASFERVGMDSVETYINTGNVLFQEGATPPDALGATLERAIVEDFDLQIKVLLREGEQVVSTAAAIPDDWHNDSKTMKCDVMFLWEDVDTSKVMDDLPIREGIDDAFYVPGAIIWKVDRDVLTKSGMNKLVGTKLYKQMTVRNANTTRKLAEMVGARLTG